LITLKEVAQAAGVSVSTASRVLSGQAAAYRIGEVTRAVVKQKAEALGFQANALARSLQSKRSGMLGLVVPDISNPFFAAIARQVTTAANQHGYSVLIADSCETSSVEQDSVKQLLARQTEGLIVCPVGNVSEHLQGVQKKKIPLVLVDRVFVAQGFTTVTSEHGLAAKQLTCALLEAGHRQIGILQGLPGTLPNTERVEGIQLAFREAGLQWNPPLLVGDDFTEKSGFDATVAILKAKPSTTALIALSAPQSLGAMRAIRQLSLSVPQDISLIAFDDHPFIDHLACPLTSASQDVGRLGETAARVLLEQLRSGKRPLQREYRIPIQVTNRKSIAEVRKQCGPFRSS